MRPRNNIMLNILCVCVCYSEAPWTRGPLDIVYPFAVPLENVYVTTLDFHSYVLYTAWNITAFRFEIHVMTSGYTAIILLQYLQSSYVVAGLKTWK